jgi:CDP-glucose 4,6-dehydratase
VESVVIDRGFWTGRRVFLSGHTGFKGAWMALLLRYLGAKVFGFALPPENREGLFTVVGLEHELVHREGDLRDLTAVEAAMAEAKPEVVIHMAAQSLVRRSYGDPVGTFATNTLGTVHVLESVRRTPSVKAVVIVTSDKCYENRGWVWGYRETDSLGGHDPYSSSKGCAELVVQSYRRSFFHTPESPRIASARAGNVIGGGDWAEDRIVPDAMRAFMRGVSLKVRNSGAVRPWQHVLDPVVAYLVLVERLWAGEDGVAEAWNFGPATSGHVSVGAIAEALARLWGLGAHWEEYGDEPLHEAPYLALDCGKALTKLGWRPLLELEDALKLTVDWYRAFQNNADMRGITLAQIEQTIHTRLDFSAHRQSFVQSATD